MLNDALERAERHENTHLRSKRTHKVVVHVIRHRRSQVVVALRDAGAVGPWEGVGHDWTVAVDTTTVGCPPLLLVVPQPRGCVERVESCSTGRRGLRGHQKRDAEGTNAPVGAGRVDVKVGLVVRVQVEDVVWDNASLVTSARRVGSNIDGLRTALVRLWTRAHGRDGASEGIRYIAQAEARQASLT